VEKSEALSVAVNACAHFSEREALRAVLAFHRSVRKRQRPPRVTLRDLNKAFERPPIGQSSRSRLIDVAVENLATVYATDNGTIEELAKLVREGLPVIVAMRASDAEANEFAVVVYADHETVLVQRPIAGKAGESIAPTSISASDFETTWYCADDDNQEKVLRWYAVLNFDNRELARRFEKGQDWTPPDRRRRTGVLLAAWAMFAIQVVLAYLSYDDPNNYTPPLVAITLAIVTFTAIDFFARPEKREYTSTLTPRWYRGYLSFWCLVPFITALSGSMWVHYQKWEDAKTDLRQVAREVKAAVEWPDPQTNADHGSKTRLDKLDDPIASIVDARGWFATDEATDRCWRAVHDSNMRMTALMISEATMVNGISNPFATLGLVAPDVDRKRLASDFASLRTWRCFTTERVNAKVANMVATRYGENKGTPEAKRFLEIARVIGHDVLVRRGEIEVVCNNVGVDTGSALMLAIAIQALFVLWIPALLAVAISRAQKRTRRAHTRRDVQRSIDLRDSKILAEDQYLFLPRMCFAMLLVLGTNYVFSPLGLKATYIMSIVDEHSLPGQTSFTLWSTSFSEAPVIIVGFVGFLLYALITATQRFVLDDFDDRAMLSLLVRGLVVILLSLALGSSDVNELASRTFVFLAGVFPVRALEAIGKRVNMSIDPDFSPEQGSNFSGLPGLDPVKVFALRAAGIQSTYDLAAMNIQDVAERVRIDPRLLGRAVDRAILIDALGIKLTERLSDFGITSATELVATTELTALIAPAGTTDHSAPDQIDAATLLRAATAAQARLHDDERVRSVRGWLAARQQDDA
jgi:hypothetical protein